MNYLAHLFLANNNSASRIGNLLGDFIKGDLKPLTIIYTRGVIEGIEHHRKLDTFTDTHEIYIRSKRRIAPVYRRWSGIIIDLAYDHFLANHWNLFCEEPLGDFVETIYDLLEKEKQLLPKRLQQVLPRIIAEDWLGSYKTLTGINLTLVRLSRRLKRENNLDSAGEEIADRYSALESDFLSFFPEAIAYAKTLC